ncbi:hypothetical protein NVP1022O_62 [Vibrio phage 1.022.O._10N.286.45.A10]|nr:hypothetical protein NVP1022O_62 [Vibrio phage 1.022.O._10N.286.45.A10]
MNKSQHVPLLVDRLNIGESTAWLWLKDDASEAYKRRVQAAITSERTDWTPIPDVAGHLESQFGVTVKDVAEWFGYDPHSLYGIIGNGRFVEKRPKRALTLIDYYLKENELC